MERFKLHHISADSILVNNEAIHLEFILKYHNPSWRKFSFIPEPQARAYSTSMLDDCY